MKEKALVTSFALGNVIDIVVTLFFLSQGLGTEFNPFARQLMQGGDTNDLIIVKVAYTAVLIGAYALAASLDSELRYPTEKTLQISVVLLWIVQFWNLLNLVTAVA